MLPNSPDMYVSNRKFRAFLFLVVIFVFLLMPGRTNTSFFCMRSDFFRCFLSVCNCKIKLRIRDFREDHQIFAIITNLCFRRYLSLQDFSKQYCFFRFFWIIVILQAISTFFLALRQPGSLFYSWGPLKWQTIHSATSSSNALLSNMSHSVFVIWALWNHF